MNRTRIIRRSGFVQIDNIAVRNSRISLRARGALAYLLSQPDEFVLDTKAWAEENLELEAAYTPVQTRKDGTAYQRDLREGRDAIRAALKELEAVGYITRQRTRYEDGTFGWMLIIDENALACGQPESTSDGKSVSGPNRENTQKAQVTPETDFPATVNPARKKTKKELNTEYSGKSPRPSGQPVPIQSPALEKATQVSMGNGCERCEATGIIELDTGCVQCDTCRGAGFRTTA